jgi:hypothetical protein
MELRRSINVKIWEDFWFSELPTEHKILWIYLITNNNTNMLGIYEISEKKMCFDTSLPLERLRKAFKDFETNKKAKYVNGYVILYNWIKNQSYNPNMIKSALKDFRSLPGNIRMSTEAKFINDLRIKNESLPNPLEGFETLSNRAIPNIEKEKEKEKEEESLKTHNEILNNLLNDENFITPICMTEKRNVNEVRNHLTLFGLSLIVKKDFKKNIKDFAQHFGNWLKYNPVPEIREVTTLSDNPPESY